MSLDAIPIHVVPPGGPGLSGNAPPLLHELLEMVQRLLDAGETSAIDLSALPLTPADLDAAARKFFIDDSLVVATLSHEKLPEAMATLPLLASFKPAAARM